MTTSPQSRQRHFASSPFRPEVERPIEVFETGDLVSHDLHGMGKVVSTDTLGVTVDFGAKTMRVVSPFRKMEKI